MQGGDSTAVVAAGLPNIEGTTTYGYYHLIATAVSGAFKSSPRSEGDTAGKNGAGGYKQLTFNASDSNAIYGASSTVQPPAIVLIPQLRY